MKTTTNILALLAAPALLLAAGTAGAQVGPSTPAPNASTTSPSRSTSNDPDAAVPNQGNDENQRSVSGSTGKKKKLTAPVTNDTRSSSPSMASHTKPALAPGAPTTDDNSPRDAGNTTPNAAAR